MATKYYAVLTNVGAAKLANATALGAQVEITQMAVGDGNGALPTPNPAQTALIHELRRAPLNSLSIDPNNANQIIAEQVIPEDVGGWWIREIGLFDKDGDLIAVANCAETYKPQLQEGSGRVQVVRMIMIVSSTAAVTLKIDPSVVLATRQYVDDQIIQVKAYVDQQLAAHVAAADPHTQYLLEADIDKYIPVGLPLPWPQATPPGGWLKCNGATFDKAKYPKLAVAYPSGALPDLRGEFLRGWDDGRGVDGGRGLLSAQSHGIPKLTGQFQSYDMGGYEGASGVFSAAKFSDFIATTGGTEGTDVRVTMDSTKTIPAANDVRPRNVAFNFIVRAA
ncbi:TPA: phage tail protein [Klebsiella pneumoniae]|uniref:phage tail-collar fiber domain-containing protein n=1 Tax=Enterobacteriaceae TaxID=543 RepID=UPI00211470DA|nr:MULTISPECIES: phage tail protein [Enterobacteriaceae]EJJ4275261.1 phage tail protein [Salmonella enterica]EKD7755547.1 phage tail protein [Shigella sonnei]MCJ6397834.1 phage tail protein [Klebsiella pneumoniae]MCP5676184.1 phage tail protein [Klebsiella pneumoniae]MDQ8090727.1 phage tail protein [Escherichia coli]